MARRSLMRVKDGVNTAAEDATTKDFNDEIASVRLSDKPLSVPSRGWLQEWKQPRGPNDR